MLRRKTSPPVLVRPPADRVIKDSQGSICSATDITDKAAEFGDIDYHTSSVDELFSRYSSSRGTGLTTAGAVQKLKEVGPNQPTPPPSRWFRKTLTYLFGGFGSILFLAAILVFIAWKPLGEPAPAIANLALAIVLVLVWVIQAAFSFWQDFSSSRVMASITGMLPEKCTVLRDGKMIHVDGREIVPGDLLRITLGNRLPADVRFVEVSPDARFDRSILTGETVPLLGSVESTDDNCLETACIGMAGTHCVSGNAWGLVVETGDRTVFGCIAQLTSAPKAGLTPLQKEILIFVAIIVCLMVTMILVVITVWASWLRKSHPGWISVPVLIVDCVSVAVAFIPEGLPIAVTASLTITANIMRVSCYFENSNTLHDSADFTCAVAEEQGPVQKPKDCRDARRSQRDLHRQDRHFDQKPDDGHGLSRRQRDEERSASTKPLREQQASPPAHQPQRCL